MKEALSPAQRRELRARAHGLHPVAMISEDGLSDGVLAEIERGLKTHELIKIRVFGADRDQREQLIAQICARTAAQPVQHIGNILVIFREKPVEEKPRAKPAASPARRTTARGAASARASTWTARPSFAPSRPRRFCPRRLWAPPVGRGRRATRTRPAGSGS